MAGNPSLCSCGSGVDEPECRPRHDLACADCGAGFRRTSNRALYCPRCRVLRQRRLAYLFSQRVREKARIARLAAAEAERSRRDPCECGSGRLRLHCDPTALTNCVDCGTTFHRHGTTHFRCDLCAAVQHAKKRAASNARRHARRLAERAAGSGQLELAPGGTLTVVAPDATSAGEDGPDAVTKSGGARAPQLDITHDDVPAAGRGRGVRRSA